MRRMPTPESVVQDRVDLTPLLDVVFIMLIFFVVTATFVRERGIDVTPPDPDVRRTPVVPEQAAIVVRIGERDQLRVDRTDVRLDALGAHLLRLRSAAPDAPVVVVPRAGSTAGVLVGVMDAARRVGIHDVRLGAFQ